MSSVKVERVPIETLGLGWLGFDHLQIVFETGIQPLEIAARWLVRDRRSARART
jgi:hypothetical protein